MDHSGSDFKQFATEWGLQHVTGSPRCPRSNALSERMVQTVEKTKLKAKDSGCEIDMALLCLRSTPIDTNLPSPAQLLDSRQPRTNLPSPSKHTRDHETAGKFLQSRQRVQKEYHDRRVKDLPPLHSGQRIQMQCDDSSGTPATVIAKRPEPRSYTIRTPKDGLYRRHRQQLRDLPTPPKRLS